MRTRRHLREHTRKLRLQLYARIHRPQVRDQRQRVRVPSVSQRRLMPGRSGHFPMRLHAR